MRPKFLIDSVILIDSFNKIEHARKWIDGVKSTDAVISVVTLSEVLSGSPDPQRDMLLLKQYDCLSIIPATAELAAQLRKQYRWQLLDAYQAALAIEHRLILVTRNTKDFNPKIHSFVEIPYTF